jgi:hypothetical protein
VISAFLGPPSPLSFLLFLESLGDLSLFAVVGFFAPPISWEKNIPLINDRYPQSDFILDDRNIFKYK